MKQKESIGEKKELVIFTTGKKAVKLRGDFHNETLWATQAEMVALFGVDQSVVSRHIRNIFKDGEVQEKSNMQNMHIANSDKPVVLYSLDIILAVGYRTSSATAIKFRQWSTTVLREHITKGFTINRAQIGENYEAFMTAVANLKALAPASNQVDTKSVLELVQLFADTWFSLDAYDKGTLTPGKVTKKNIKLTAEELISGVTVLKTELLKKGEASENFAQERQLESVEGIVGNVMQSFGGKALYPTVEEKAAHLLYFVIKNHPFVDGNKRTGAYAFVWFLQKAKVLDTNRLTPAALTALTLLIAESDPQDKERMVELVVLLVAGPKRKK
jgi:prophage maintenance system killer protein